MGAIQNALNQAAGAALASAGTAALAKGAAAAESQAKFHANMEAAALPEKEAELALAQSEAARTQKLGESELQKLTDKENVDKTYHNIVNRIEEKEGGLTLDQEHKYDEKRTSKWMAAESEQKGRDWNINLQYDKEKARLSTELAAAQVQAKANQINLIRDRVKKLGIKGGNR